MAVAAAAMTSPTASMATDRATAATYLAAITGSRRGARVNVVSAVRCVHSDVIASRPMIGARKATTVVDAAAVVVERHLDPGLRELVDEHAADEPDDDSEQPAAAAGVGQLAQLDRRERRRTAAGGWAPTLVGAGAGRVGVVVVIVLDRLPWVAGRGIRPRWPGRRRSWSRSRRVAVSAKKSSSSPELSPSRSSSRTCRLARATRPTCSAVAWTRSAPLDVGLVSNPAARRAPVEGGGVEPADGRALPGQQVVEGVVGDDAAPTDDDEPVDGRLHLARAGGWTAAPCRRRPAKSCSSIRIQRMPSGSMPLAGSSRISTAGSPISAVPMPSRWRMPSE